jgi:oxygen-independent coproporphyrinogen-3 oxidase
LKDTPDDQLRRAVIQSLICRFDLDIVALEKNYGINFQIYFADIYAALLHMAKDGLLKLNAQRLEILPEGRLLAQSICQLFDRYSPLCKTTIDAPGALIT